MIKFCKKCQVETERYNNGGCKPCVSLWGKSYRKANPDKLRDAMRRYQKNNRDKVNAYNAAYRKANPEKSRGYQAKYYALNKEKVSEHHAAYYALNIEKIKATHLAYRKANKDKERVRKSAYYVANPEVGRAIARNRRARKRNSGGTHTAEDVRKLLTLQKSKCACCKTSIKHGYHVDHVIALINGGSNDRLNLQLLCPPCNMQKHAKHPIDFMQSRGFLL